MKRPVALMVAAATASTAKAALVPAARGEAPGRMMLITSTPPTPASCLGESFYGAYGGSADDRQYIYMPGSPCLWSDDGLDSFTAGSLVPLEADMTAQSRKESRIVWVGQAGLEPSIIGDAEIGSIDASWSVIQMRADILMADPATATGPDKRDSQMVFAQPDADTQIEHLEPIRLLHKTDASMLLDVPVSYIGILDTILPPHLVPVALPLEPLPAMANGLPVPREQAAYLGNITKHLKFSSELDTILAEGIDADEIRRNVRWLTGEAPSGIETRHSFSSGAKRAAEWIKGVSACCTQALTMC